MKVISAGTARVIQHLMNAVQGKGTVAIFTAVQKEGKGSTIDSGKNAKNYAELGNLLNTLKNGAIPLAGIWQGTAEDSYLVPNISLDMAKKLNAGYHQWAFIFAGPETSGSFQLWATPDNQAGADSYAVMTSWNNFAVGGLKDPQGYSKTKDGDKFSFYQGGDTPQEYMKALMELNKWSNESIDSVKVDFRDVDRVERTKEKHNKLQEQISAGKGGKVMSQTTLKTVAAVNQLKAEYVAINGNDSGFHSWLERSMDPELFQFTQAAINQAREMAPIIPDFKEGDVIDHNGTLYVVAVPGDKSLTCTQWEDPTPGESVEITPDITTTIEGHIGVGAFGDGSDEGKIQDLTAVTAAKKVDKVSGVWFNLNPNKDSYQVKYPFSISSWSEILKVAVISPFSDGKGVADVPAGFMSWYKHGSLEGVPIVVDYLLTPEDVQSISDMEEEDIPWESRIVSISVDLKACGFQGIPDSAIEGILNKYGAGNYGDESSFEQLANKRDGLSVTAAKTEGAGEVSPENTAKIIEYVSNTENLDDSQFHTFVESLGVDPHEAEEIIYREFNKVNASIPANFHPTSRFGAKGYWISPTGIMSVCNTSHIAEVIKRPEAFGLTREEIEAVYAEAGEPLGHEGVAREKIMKGLLNKGWTRIRWVPANYSWTVQVARLSKAVLDNLQSWAFELLSTDEDNKNTDVTIVPIDSGVSPSHLSLPDVAADKLFAMASDRVISDADRPLTTPPFYKVWYWGVDTDLEKPPVVLFDKISRKKWAEYIKEKSLNFVPEETSTALVSGHYNDKEGNAYLIGYPDQEHPFEATSSDNSDDSRVYMQKLNNRAAVLAAFGNPPAGVELSWNKMEEEPEKLTVYFDGRSPEARDYADRLKKEGKDMVQLTNKPGKSFTKAAKPVAEFKKGDTVEVSDPSKVIKDFQDTAKEMNLYRYYGDALPHNSDIKNVEIITEPFWTGVEEHGFYVYGIIVEFSNRWSQREWREYILPQTALVMGKKTTAALGDPHPRDVRKSAGDFISMVKTLNSSLEEFKGLFDTFLLSIDSYVLPDIDAGDTQRIEKIVDKIRAADQNFTSTGDVVDMVEELYEALDGVAGFEVDASDKNSFWQKLPYSAQTQLKKELGDIDVETVFYEGKMILINRHKQLSSLLSNNEFKVGPNGEVGFMISRDYVNLVKFSDFAVLKDIMAKAENIQTVINKYLGDDLSSKASIKTVAVVSVEKIATEEGYDFYMGTSDGKYFYNVVPEGAPSPDKGYYSLQDILKQPDIPEVFKDFAKNEMTLSE